jgi:hypothetical protein
MADDRSTLAYALMRQQRRVSVLERTSMSDTVTTPWSVCPLLGTSACTLHMSAFDPKQTLSRPLTGVVKTITIISCGLRIRITGSVKALGGETVGGHFVYAPTRPATVQ